MNDLKKDPRVLIVSHNPFSINFNMGRTLSGFFKGWDKESIAQLFFRPEVPSGNVCENYYCFTDVDAIKSIFVRNKKGTIIKKEIKESSNIDLTVGKYSMAYGLGPQKKPIISMCRDLVWRLSSWNNKYFKKWLMDFSPDIVFFASGDYCFSYKIVLKIAKSYGIPLITFCADDYFLYSVNNNKKMGKVYHQKLLRSAKKIINYSSMIITLNDLMAIDYSHLFAKSCRVIYTGTNYSFDNNRIRDNRICYLGNLGLGRAETIVNFANRFHAFCSDNNLDIKIEVYSNEQRKEILDIIKKCDYVSFRGPISYKEVETVTKSSCAVLHVESFEENNKNRVKYSFSTKIADILASGTPLIAYGPPDIASIAYLKNNGCAIVISHDDEFDDEILKLFNREYAEETVRRAREIAKMNHDCDNNVKLIKQFIIEAIDSYKTSSRDCKNVTRDNNRSWK